MRVLIIAGHGEGDSGAVGCGKKESELVRELLPLVVSHMSTDLEIYPTSKNCYKQIKKGFIPKWTDYDFVLELHFNAFNGVAGGTEVLVHAEQPDTHIAMLMAQYISNVGFINRGVKKRTDLQNMNYCHKAGVNYALVETCFIDNESNMKLYEANKDKVAKAIARAFPVAEISPDTEEEVMYRVQVGAFKNRANAEALLEKVKAAGFSGFIAKG